MRASSEGTASPVTVAVTTRSTSDGREVGGLERVDERAGAQLDGVLDEEVVGVPEVAEPGVLVEREDGVASLDPRVGVEAAQQRPVEAALGDELARRPR